MDALRLEGNGSLRAASFAEAISEEAEIGKSMRLAISTHPDDEQVEIFSCATKTTLLLPKKDIDLLIDALRNLDQIGLSPETVCLDLSS